MKLKKTNSATLEAIQQRDVKIQIEMASPPPHGVLSEQAFTGTAFRHRQRVPTILKSTLREHNSERRSIREGEEGEEVQKQKLGKVGSFIRSKIRNTLSKIKNKSYCEICESEVLKSKEHKQAHMCNCEHKDQFCQSCLHHYVIYKVKTFEEVYCPHQGCPEMLDTGTEFFKSLPADIQKNYKKLHQFYLTSQDPSLKLCPKEECEGVIKMTENAENKMICNTCLTEFCSKCLLEAHEGQCDQKELKFFQENLHYRQCVKCKFVIEKDQGCNHITCRCGYQFCYVCGSRWVSAHYGNHDQNGNLIEVNPVQAPAPENEQPCCDCGCMDELCGATIASVFKLPIKIILLLLLFLLVAFIFITRDIFVITGMLIVTIIAGMFGYSFDILSQTEGVYCFLGVLFFPVVMIMGVGRSFQEIFCDVMPQIEQDLREICCVSTTRICNI